MIILVDTSIWIDFFRGEENSETKLLKEFLQDGSTEIALTDLIFCEILQGIKNYSQEAEIQQILLKLPIFTSGGIELASSAAANYRSLRKRGITIRSTIDCLIATYALEHKLSLFHKDRDFEPFEEHLGLETIKVSKRGSKK